MRWLPFAGLALAVGLLASGLYDYWPETSDDAYITLRYSQSLAEGRGPYFNPGERVEGYTNSLLMLVVALAIRLAGPEIAPPAAKLVGALAAVGCVVVAFVLARSSARSSGASVNVADLAGALAALLLAASASFSLNTTWGLETTLFGRHRPETRSLYEVVRDNLETLYGAIDDGAIAVRIPKHARKELEAYLDCGLLCRGFARLRCEECGESQVVAFSCAADGRRRDGSGCARRRSRWWRSADRIRRPRPRAGRRRRPGAAGGRRR